MGGGQQNNWEPQSTEVPFILQRERLGGGDKQGDTHGYLRSVHPYSYVFA